VGFIRFIQSRRHPESGVEDGLFGLAYELRDSPRVAAEDRAALADALMWFAKHLETPSRFNRTKSKGFYRRNTRGIAWFKDTATEHLARMHEIRRVLEQNGQVVEMLSEARVGYVVYEDAFQVVAEPFSETRTR
jgi:type III secretion system FlhB-like substrate exporter